MFKFYFARSMREIVGHLILIGIPVAIIAFFNYIFAGGIITLAANQYSLPYVTVLAVGFALTFQIYGATLSFEVLGGDFFSSMRDRLLASPAEPRNLAVSILGAGCLVSALQTTAILLFSSLVLKADLGPLHLVSPLLAISVVFNQLLGSAILLVSGSVKLANTIVTVYGAVVPMTVGLYFPLPSGPVLDFLSHYLSPMALANTAILGVIKGELTFALLPTAVLFALCVVLFFVIRPLIRRLAA